MARVTMTLEVDCPAQEALLRSYHAFLQELDALGATAAPGQALDVLEGAVLEKGREQLRATLETAVQQRLEVAEKKGRRCGVATAVSTGRTAARPRVGS
jgi:hypothetical protein